MTRLPLVVATLVVAALVASAGTATAGPMMGIGQAGLGPGFGRALDRGFDLGPELTVLGSFADGGSATAIGVDAVMSFYVDDAVEIEQSITDRLLGRPPRSRLPWLSHPAVQFHIGAVFDVEGGRRQLHVAAGSGVSWLGIALAMVSEDIDDVPNGFAFGPELRLRHRFGQPARHAWSAGVLARGELFVNQRDAHPDRVTVGAFVMWGW